MTEPKKEARGGSRVGSGRKKGSSSYGESTKAIRVPESMINEVKLMLDHRKLSHTSPKIIPPDTIFIPAPIPRKISNPLFSGKVSAGFPSPADDYVEKTLDLNDLLVKTPAATFFVRATGDSMLGAGIHSNDILVVDRSIPPSVGKIIICALNDELTVKRLKSTDKEIILGAENPEHPDITIQEGTELIIWGVVTNVIHPV